ncbi:hypothetical protein FGM00_16240 [Aggregatimonas sangjinii]|uniref:Uncharacterized protein n=1 Tax=Aggregatimonas sangjinii TaxID=2583587 RepID=A0A5B7STQ6_9FLAO|nr:hypothetical protein [Aggregatimonas sangjinii]QCX01582.1 hypothetical protein FGM00_16240 [Aggregatimonas sangjinii]
MKTMNYALLLSFLFFGIGCSNQEDFKTEELSATESRARETQEPQLLSEPLLHQVYLEEELSYLNCQEENLLIDLDNGVPGAEEALEENRQLTELNHRYSEFLDELISAGRLCRPGVKCPKPKPNPCGDERGCISNCPILIYDFSNIISITSKIDVSVVNGGGEVCGGIGEIEQIDENLYEASFETDECCDGFLQVTKEFEAAPQGKISYRIPITCNH